MPHPSPPPSIPGFAVLLCSASRYATFPLHLALCSSRRPPSPGSAVGLPRRLSRLVDANREDTGHVLPECRAGRQPRRARRRLLKGLHIDGRVKVRTLEGGVSITRICILTMVRESVDLKWPAELAHSPYNVVVSCSMRSLYVGMRFWHSMT